MLSFAMDYKLIAQRIILQAVKDYIKGSKEAEKFIWSNSKYSKAVFLSANLNIRLFRIQCREARRKSNGKETCKCRS